MIKKDTDSFDELVYLIGKHGAYRPPSDVSYTMALVINRLGGWSHVCTWRDKDLPDRRIAFSHVMRDVTRLLSSPAAHTLPEVRLGGLHEVQSIRP